VERRQAARRRTRRATAIARERAHRCAWHRPLHRRRDRIDRIRRAGRTRRRQRGARARPRVHDPRRHQVDRRPACRVDARERADDRAPCRPRPGRPQPRLDGARRNRLCSDCTTMPDLPDRGVVLDTRRRLAERPAAQASQRAAGARARSTVDRRRRRSRAGPPHTGWLVRRAMGATSGGVARRDRTRVARHTRGRCRGRPPRTDARAPALAHRCVPRRDAGAACQRW
jgi:hypothetical protein